MRIAKYIMLFGISIIYESACFADDFRWSGFFNAGVSYAESQEKYLDRINDQVSWDGDTYLGLNLGKKIDDNLFLQAQFFGHDRNDGIIADWFFANYQFDSYNKIKVGKIKYPGALISEFVDASHLFPWVRPPQEFYGHNEASVVAVFEAFKGVNYIHSWFFNQDENIVTLQTYGGEISADKEGEASYKKMFGSKLSFESEDVELYVSYLTARIEEAEDHGEEEEETEEAEVSAESDNDRLDVLNLGWHIMMNQFVSRGEYSSISVDGVDELDTDIWYVMTGYRLGSWLPHVTVASFKQDTGLEHDSLTLGLRFELNPRSSLKFELQQLKPEGEAGGEGVFFEELPDDDSVNVASIAYTLVF